MSKSSNRIDFENFGTRMRHVMNLIRICLKKPLSVGSSAGDGLLAVLNSCHRRRMTLARNKNSISEDKNLAKNSRSYDFTYIINMICYTIWINKYLTYYSKRIYIYWFIFSRIINFWKWQKQLIKPRIDW